MYVSPASTYLYLRNPFFFARACFRKLEIINVQSFARRSIQITCLSLNRKIDCIHPSAASFLPQANYIGLQLHQSLGQTMLHHSVVSCFGFVHFTGLVFKRAILFFGEAVTYWSVSALMPHIPQTNKVSNYLFHKVEIQLFSNHNLDLKHPLLLWE